MKPLAALFAAMLSVAGVFTGSGQSSVSHITLEAPRTNKPAAAAPAVSFGNMVATTAQTVETTEPLPEPTETPTPSPTTPPTPTPTLRPVRKHAFKIALLGDSMIDTLGEGLPQLKTTLKREYPDVSFTLLNYGVGSTNIEYGIERITNGYSYREREFPSLASTKPDIVVIESFAYNPFPSTDGSLERYGFALSKIVRTVETSIPGVRIVMAATIAPDSRTFGDGAPGIRFSPQEKLERTAVIRSYLDSAIAFAGKNNLPLADAYHASLRNQGGNPRYIDAKDHIHYSDEGRALFARTLTTTIIKSRLLE